MTRSRAGPSVQTERTASWRGARLGGAGILRGQCGANAAGPPGRLRSYLASERRNLSTAACVIRYSPRAPLSRSFRQSRPSTSKPRSHISCTARMLQPSTSAACAVPISLGKASTFPPGSKMASVRSVTSGTCDQRNCARDSAAPVALVRSDGVVFLALIVAIPFNATTTLFPIPLPA